MSLWKWGFVPERFIGFDNYLRIFTEEIVVQENWKEFEKQAIDITAKTGVPALVMSNGKNGSTFRAWLRTFGVDPISQDATSLNFDNPQSVELAAMLKNLLDKKAILLAQDTEQEFTNGRSAMEIGTTARTSSKLDLIKDKFKWGITLIPRGDSTKKVTELYGGNQVLSCWRIHPR